MKVKSYFFLNTFLVTTLWPVFLYADQTLDPLVVKQEKSNNIDPFATKKIEKVSPEKIKNPSRQTLTEIIQDQSGVEAQTYCSNCGAKRLTINGLRGANTSILIDGLPLHSAVSSFYGIDSIPPLGIEEIEVMRGAGASLVNPEAIGGTINIISIDPTKNFSSFSTSFSVNDDFEGSAQNHNVIISRTNDSKSLGFVLGGQWTEQKPWDEDRNNIAESPGRDAYSFFSKLKFSIDAKNELSLRGSFNELEILGGPSNPVRPTQVRTIPARPLDFEVEGDVESNYIGDPLKITDWIALKRYEGQLKWKSYLSDTLTLNLNSGVAVQEQDSIYQHGFDYANKDIMWVGDVNIEKALSNHILKAGVFFKDQRLRSTSVELFEIDELAEDGFNHQSYAAYVQDTWLISSEWEMDFALRLDSLSVDWIDLDQKLQDFIAAPRFMLKNTINDHLTQRLSYGYGYRSPLTYFESQHGNNEAGFTINIDELEKAHSAVYSLSYNTPGYYATFGAHYTHLMDMAFGIEPTEGVTPGDRRPVEYRNSDEDYDIWALDFLAGYKVFEGWMIEAGYEHFIFEDGYVEKLPTAAIEQRVQLKSTFKKGPWTSYVNLSWVPSRDLSRYADYSDHYRSFVFSGSGEFVFQELKDQKAPDFFLLDFNVSYDFNSKWRLLLGVNNLLDFTQAGSGDNPSTWHNHNGHAHYDGLHTWGPNRGREWFMQLSVDI